MTALLTIGELASHSRTTPRALRHFEALGLLHPKRSEAGQRLYDANATLQLGRIMLLKRAGYSLQTIRTLLSTRTLDPSTLLDAQIDLLAEQARTLETRLFQLRATRALLETGTTLDIEELCTLIRQGETTMSDAHWKPVLDRYFTEADKQRWEAAKSHFKPGECDDYATAWQDLIARTDTARRQNLPPENPKAIALLKEWQALQERLVDTVGKDQWQKVSQMYQDMNTWQTDTVHAPFSAETYAYINSIATEAKARNLI